MIFKQLDKVSRVGRQLEKGLKLGRQLNTAITTIRPAVMEGKKFISNLERR